MCKPTFDVGSLSNLVLIYHCINYMNKSDHRTELVQIEGGYIA